MTKEVFLQTHDAQVLEVVFSEEARLKAISDASEIFKYRLSVALEATSDDAADFTVDEPPTASRAQARARSAADTSAQVCLLLNRILPSRRSPANLLFNAPRLISFNGMPELCWRRIHRPHTTGDLRMSAVSFLFNASSFL